MSDQSLKDEFSALVKTVAHLRAPDGCPWDREQTHLTLRKHMIEEAFEAVEVMDKVSSAEALKDQELSRHFKEELGDVLMQVLLNSQLADEANAFDMGDVVRELNDKLIRRHPHVFGDQKANNASEALATWEAQKKKEKKEDESVLAGVPAHLPALHKALKVLNRVTRVGFQWDNLKEPFEKVEEEVSELKAELDKIENPKSIDSSQLKKIEAEIGDVLFTVSNIAYLTGVNPEDALRTTLNRFESRFRFVEKSVKESGKKMTDVDLSEMNRHWDKAKELERSK